MSYIPSRSVNDMPTDNTNAVLIKFVTNTGGGEPGEPCPMDCDAADALIEAYYPIANPTYDHCYQVRSATSLPIILFSFDAKLFTFFKFKSHKNSGLGTQELMP